MAALPDGPLPPGPWHEQDLFGDHTITGRDHPETSVYAARLALPKTGSIRHNVLRAIAKRGPDGATDEEIQDTLGCRANTQRPRRVELVNEGWVEDSGLRRPTVTGAPSIVWRLSQRGHDAWLR